MKKLLSTLLLMTLVMGCSETSIESEPGSRPLDATENFGGTDIDMESEPNSQPTDTTENVGGSVVIPRPRGPRKEILYGGSTSGKEILTPSGKEIESAGGKPEKEERNRAEEGEETERRTSGTLAEGYRWVRGVTGLDENGDEIWETPVLVGPWKVMDDVWVALKMREAENIPDNAWMKLDFYTSPDEGDWGFVALHIATIWFNLKECFPSSFTTQPVCLKKPFIAGTANQEKNIEHVKGVKASFGGLRGNTHFRIDRIHLFTPHWHVRANVRNGDRLGNGSLNVSCSFFGYFDEDCAISDDAFRGMGMWAPLHEPFQNHEAIRAQEDALRRGDRRLSSTRVELSR